MRNVKLIVSLICISGMLAITLAMQAQSDVGTVSGTVTDSSGAVVPNASVELRDLATNIAATSKTNAAGQYAFSRVTPGNYKITVNAPNFSAGVVNNLQVSVGKVSMANITLQVGAATQVVEVQAGAVNELQTSDASVGNVLNERALANMPNLNRDATSLILLQPGTMPAPGAATDENVGGQVAGARSDQNTFMLDGGDATSNTDANSAYTNNFNATPRGAIPTPVESLEEFRVITNNNTAGFQRSAGAEVQMVTKRGTNSLHGAVYEYMQQDETNANTWERNHLHQAKPELRDNRFGAKLGGPIIKDKTFFFGLWESRHYLRGDSVTRWAPTAEILAGNIGYRNTAGGITYIPVASMDPLGVGLNPVVAQVWNSMPLANSGTGGDGVNFLNFTAPATQTVNEEFGVARLDHQITSKWHAMTSYRYGVTDAATLNQVQVLKTGLKSTSSRPLQPRYLVLGITGQLTNSITNDLHLDYLRHWWQWGTAGAKPQTSGLPAALQLVNEGAGNGVVPINIDTQQARQRNWNGKDFNLIDNLSWLKGKHLFQIGGRFGWQRLNHLRNDKVTGGMTDPIYYSVYSSGSYNQIGGIPAPADMATSFRTSWRRTYVAMLGMVSQATQVLTRNGSLQPNPAGQWISQHTVTDNWQLNFTDTWRLSPSLTLTYGLTYGVQLPPYEQSGQQTMEIDATTGKMFSVDQYLNGKKAAALAGNSYNPIIGFMPIKATGRKYPFDPDYTNLGPHIAAAWNPSIKADSWLGRIFGDRKTVIRAGWTRAFDRVNGVDIVMTPALGVGFADLGICRGPVANGTCAGSTTPATAYRVGTSTPISIPGLTAINAPVIPGQYYETGVGMVAPATVPDANTPYSGRDWHIDPRRQIGSTDIFDLSVQRELPARMLLEVGFIGRLSRDLYQKVDLNQVPYMYTKGGQSFAQAFDNLQLALNGNGAWTVQPFFETALAGSSYCATYASCTAAVVDQDGSNISARDTFDTFADMDPYWTSGPMLRFNDQVGTFDSTVSRGKARYAGMFVSLRKAYAHGLNFDFNYTLSKSMDQLGWNQDIIDVMLDGYNPNRSYGMSQFDRRHVANAFATYELPFGRGKRYASSGFLSKVFGGWSTSYIFTIASGIPLQPYNGNSCGLEWGDGGYYADCSSMIPISRQTAIATRHNTTTVTGGWGSDSTDGNYPNAFADPSAVATNYRLPLYSDARAGLWNFMRGQKRWNLDFGVSKTTHITEGTSIRFEAQMINVFNHVMFGDPNTDISSNNDFGVLNRQYNTPRWIQWGLRFDF